ncbi:MAG: T9SS type A sorting domain-containing protein [Candidatus Cloacimonetes bacterium]|nr:T9SS type A sorting domain-containing protein [Candidatus Cloacimonadota bacterium]
MLKKRRFTSIIVFCCFVFVSITINTYAQTPNWQWAQKAGGTDDDRAMCIQLDNVGNIYVSGFFNSSANFGPYSLTSDGFSDIFVAKMDQYGNWLWAVKAGGTDYDQGLNLTVDNSNNCYITGYCGSNATFGQYSITGSGNKDIFVAKINANGTWQWATGAGGTDYDRGYGIATTPLGISYVTGYFEDTATFGMQSLVSNGSSDIFVAKIDASGTWQWAEGAGSSNYDEGKKIVVDNTENVYLTGGFCETLNLGSHSVVSLGYSDIFVAKIDQTANWLWAASGGGTYVDFSYGIGLDGVGNCYVMGDFFYTAYFGEHSVTASGSNDIFVAQLESTIAVDDVQHSCSEINNFPNPFNNRTTISYSLKSASPISFEIYNLKGQLIEIILDENIQAGDHTLEWNCQNVPAGVYFLKMKAGGEESIIKLVLIK